MIIETKMQKNIFNQEKSNIRTQGIKTNKYFRPVATGIVSAFCPPDEGSQN